MFSMGIGWLPLGAWLATVSKWLCCLLCRSDPSPGEVCSYSSLVMLSVQLLFWPWEHLWGRVFNLRHCIPFLLSIVSWIYFAFAALCMWVQVTYLHADCRCWWYFLFIDVFHGSLAPFSKQRVTLWTSVQSQSTTNSLLVRVVATSVRCETTRGPASSSPPLRTKIRNWSLSWEQRRLSKKHRRNWRPSSRTWYELFLFSCLALLQGVMKDLLVLKPFAALCGSSGRIFLTLGWSCKLIAVECSQLVPITRTGGVD